MLLCVKNYLWVVYIFVKVIIKVFHVGACILVKRVQGNKLYNM